jgi:hypothetical protein
LPLPSDKVIKILLKYQLPTPSKKKLPKGWVYMEDEEAEEVKEDITDPCHYKLLHQPPSTNLFKPTPMLTSSLPAKLGHKATNKILGGAMSPSASLTT